MATIARIGYGAKFAKRTATGPDVYTDFAELLSFTPPSPSREMADATHMESPDRYREFIEGLRDGGEAGATFNYTKAAHTLLRADLDSSVVQTYRATLADASTFTFSGLITECPVETVEIEGKMTMSATFKVSGKPVFVAGV